jgi:hypothetical protein
VLAFLSKDLQLVSQPLNFMFDQQKWLGAIREMNIPEGLNLFVLMVSPEDELLSTVIMLVYTTVEYVDHSLFQPLGLGSALTTG